MQQIVELLTERLLSCEALVKGFSTAVPCCHTSAASFSPCHHHQYLKSCQPSGFLVYLAEFIFVKCPGKGQCHVSGALHRPDQSRSRKLVQHKEVTEHVLPAQQQKSSDGSNMHKQLFEMHKQLFALHKQLFGQHLLPVPSCGVQFYGSTWWDCCRLPI